MRWSMWSVWFLALRGKGVASAVVVLERWLVPWMAVHWLADWWSMATHTRPLGGRREWRRKLLFKVTTQE